MKKSLLQQLLLYRYRYVVAYVLFFALLVSLLIIELQSVPSGLSSAERQSAVQSFEIKLRPDINLIDLPYHLLQKASLRLLGLNDLAIKLPSLVFGLFSGIAILLLLRRWFSHNVAIIAALFIITNVLFLATARTGTPAIMLIFFSAAILLVATFITQEARWQFFWRIILGALLALSLYTPLSLYVIASCFIAGLLHPHARYFFKRYGGRQFVGALFLFIPLIAPLLYGIWLHHHVVAELLGYPGRFPDAATFGHGLLAVATRLGGIASPHIGEYVQPAFSIVSLALIALGFFRALVDIHASRTYALLIWLAVITPAVVISQSYIPILFVPTALFIAIGLQMLIREWYRLFPRNPYARLFGLIPLLILIGGVIIFNYANYFYGMRYSPATAAAYSNDLRLLNDVLARKDIDMRTVTVAANDRDVAFYRILTASKPGVAVIPVISWQPDSKGVSVVAASSTPTIADTSLKLLSVNSNQENALRWRTYVK